MWEGPHIFGGTLVGVLYEDSEWLRAELFTCKETGIWAGFSLFAAERPVVCCFPFFLNACLYCNRTYSYGYIAQDDWMFLWTCHFPQNVMLDTTYFIISLEVEVKFGAFKMV